MIKSIYVYLEPQTTIYKWLFQLDNSKYLYRKWLFHQTSIYKWLFGVPGIEYDNKPYNKGKYNPLYNLENQLFSLLNCQGEIPLRPPSTWKPSAIQASLISLPIRNLLKYGNGLGRDSLEGVPTVGGPLEKSLKLETSNT